LSPLDPSAGRKKLTDYSMGERRMAIPARGSPARRGASSRPTFWAHLMTVTTKSKRPREEGRAPLWLKLLAGLLLLPVVWLVIATAGDAVLPRESSAGYLLWLWLVPFASVVVLGLFPLAS